ncbi:MAG TPA: hypothetical protein VM389_03215, partial [Phycisphaerae bacterium]|nr:hypothetical protein [Phycisphaerae bacterium]
HDFPGYFHAVLPLDTNDVKQYVLLTRPRHWATFQDFAPAPKLPPAPPATRPAVRPSSRQATGAGSDGASPNGASTQPAVGAAPDGAAKASDSFGAVAERSLVDPAAWIDLDRNQVKSPPRSAQASKEAAIKWFRDDGIDAWRELKCRGLGCPDLKAVELDEAEWDGLTAAQLDEALGMRKAVQSTDEGLVKIVYLKGAEGRPMTYAFRTREGGSGILQILEAQTTDRPLFLKIRYKMVNLASPSKSTTRPAVRQGSPQGPDGAPAQPAGRLVFDPVGNIKAVKPKDWVVQKVVKGDQPFGLVAGKGTGIYLGPPRREDDPEQKQMPYASVVWIMPADYSGDPLQTEGRLQMPTPQLIATLADAKVYVWGLSAWPAPAGARAGIQAAVNRYPTTAPADGRRSALLTRLARLGVTPKTTRRMVFVGSEGGFGVDTRVEAVPDMRKGVWTAIAVARPFNRIVFSGFRRVEFYTAADAAKPAAVLCVNQTDSTHLEGRYQDRFRCAGLTELTEPLLRAQYERRHPPAVRQGLPQAATGASPDGASPNGASTTRPSSSQAQPAGKGSAEERLQRLWVALGSADPKEADQAVKGMVALSDRAVAFLGERFEPPPADAAHVKALIAKLDDAKYAVRKKAHDELMLLGRAALPALKQALKQPKLSAEARARIKGVVENWTSPPPGTAQAKRFEAALQVLAEIRTAPAKGMRTRLGREEWSWGKAAEGVQCRLRADKRVWEAGQSPTFKADFWNRGKRELQFILAPALWEIEWDGLWYRATVAHSGRVKVFPLGPGHQRTDIPVPLEERWGWRSKPKREPLVFEPGKHRIRVAFTVHAANEQPGRPVRAVSNPVEIEILPAKTAPPAPNGASPDGAGTRQADKPAVRQGSPQTTTRPSARPEGDKDLSRLCDALGSIDPVESARAVRTLAAMGDRAVVVLADRLYAAPAEADPGQIRQLIGDLDNRLFAERQRAQERLTELGAAARPALRGVLKDAEPPPEVAMRVREILVQCDRLFSAAASARRFDAAAETAARIETPRGRQLLARLRREGWRRWHWGEPVDGLRARLRTPNAVSLADVAARGATVEVVIENCSDAPVVWIGSGSVRATMPGAAAVGNWPGPAFAVTLGTGTRAATASEYHLAPGGGLTVTARMPSKPTRAGRYQVECRVLRYVRPNVWNEQAIECPPTVFGVVAAGQSRPPTEDPVRTRAGAWGPTVEGMRVRLLDGTFNPGGVPGLSLDAANYGDRSMLLALTHDWVDVELDGV